MTPSWRVTVLILSCTIVLLVAAYWSTAQSMAKLWFTSTYSYAGFILPISLYLVWRIRRDLASSVPSPSFWILPLVPALAFAWLLGEMTSTAVIQHFFLVAMIVTLIWGEIGTPAARVLGMPLVFLFLAVPMGDSLIPWLQDFSAWFAMKLLDLTKVPALLEGRIITIPGGRWEVAEACSGIRYLLATITIGFVYAAITYRKWGRRLAFLLASALIPVLANGLRVYGIILTDYLGGTRIARSADHILAGWLFLSIITVLLFAVGMRWREEAPKLPSKDFSSEGEFTRHASLEKKAPNSVSRLILFAVVALALASAAPLAATLFSQKSDTTNPNLRAPSVSLPWSPTGRDLFGWRPVMLAPDAEVLESYEWEGHVVKLYVAYYESGGKDAKLVSSTNSLFDRFRWQRVGEGSSEARIEGKLIRVHQISVRSPAASLLLWHWYWADGKFTSGEYEAKWLLAKSRLMRSRLGSALIVAAIEEQPGDFSATAILGNFVDHLSLSESLRSPTPNEGSGLPPRRNTGSPCAGCSDFDYGEFEMLSKVSLASTEPLNGSPDRKAVRNSLFASDFFPAFK
jgi:exosortase A